MTIPPVIIPEQQFNDADGHPYAGGSLATYVPGTTTPKQTWLDPGQAALNTNPIVLDAAGRCLLYGDGDYRLILRDAAGNLIWDIPATTLVSAAMYPVVSAPTIADAVHLLGLDNTVTAAALASAISAEQAARIAADNAEIAARTAAIANLQSQIDAINAAIGALPGPTAVPLIQEHTNEVSDVDGHKRVTFASSYSAQPTVVITVGGAGYGAECIVANPDNSGFDVWFAFPSTTPLPVGPIQFGWIASGPR